jgi:hypothetical protein
VVTDLGRQSILLVVSREWLITTEIDRGKGARFSAQEPNDRSKETKLKTQSYSYDACLAASERIRWRVEDIIGGDNRLDFTKPFMPETLARVKPLEFLTPAERLVLNHIRGNTYLYVFGLVEEFILPFVMDHARLESGPGEELRTRALLQFAGEEAKHIHLFRRFREEFTKGFGTPCAVIGPPGDIAKHVLSHDPLAVALVILQIEWMSQAHYVDSVKDDGGLDPTFKSLLKHHWMEEAQHAKLDTLMVETLAAGRGESEILAAFEQFLSIGLFLDSGLEQQQIFEHQAFEAASGRTLTSGEAAQFVAVQRQASRYTFLGSGMTHPNVLATVRRLNASAADRLKEISASFC